MPRKRSWDRSSTGTRWRGPPKRRAPRRNRLTTSAARWRIAVRLPACSHGAPPRRLPPERMDTELAKLHVETTINGEPAEFLCEPQETLLSALRNGVGLT